eukprot:3229552-Rhodomonas_salina.1
MDLDLLPGHLTSAIALRAPYAMSGTDLAYGNRSGTDLACVVLPESPITYEQRIISFYICLNTSIAVCTTRQPYQRVHVQEHTVHRTPKHVRY